MNSQSTHKTLRCLLGAGLLLSSAAVASATLVTFQVDMSLATFDPSTQTVAARGDFDGWTPVPLTNNPAGANPTVWTGTTNLPDSLNGKVMQYKYTIEPAGTYEAVASGGSHNRLATLPTATGGSFVLPKVFYGDSGTTTTEVTFQVDMAQQINTGTFLPGTSLLYARGFFNGWSTDVVMTNDTSILRTNQNGLVTSNVYVSVYEITGSPGQTIDYKYYFDTGTTWESPAPNSGDPADNNNRFFSLAQTGPQRVPIVFFNDAPYAPVVTVDVTFQVDMTAQILSGHYDPVTDYVEVRGDFNSWGTPQILCTNDLAAANTNLYKAVVHLTDGVGATRSYKFWASGIGIPNTGWENGNNRSFQIANTNSEFLPVVYFDNVTPGNFLPADTVVTFRVSMTNAVNTFGTAFNAQNDQVVINGLPAGTFADWAQFSLLTVITNYPVPSKIYSIDYLVPKGSPVKQIYKYGFMNGIDAIDNEAGVNTNHVRYIRSTGTYMMPLDTFGSMVTEDSFGNFKVLSSTAGHAMLSWTGRPGVHLQSNTNLVGGTWVDHLETDGMSATNWPTSGANLYFRLVQP